MNVTEQYFPIGLFIMLYKVVLTSQSVDETLKSDHLKFGIVCFIIFSKWKDEKNTYLFT